ncbi:MAG: UDP-N-acetylmuramoyl-tripeptide--D-alanyl-D-alanine ligase [Brevinemataceae bacterium]
MIGEIKTLFGHEFFKKALGVKPVNESDFMIRNFIINSNIKEDAELSCFVGIKGNRFDGNDFFDQAYNNGVRVFVLEKMPQNIPHDAVIYLVEDTINALALLAAVHKNDLMIPHILITGSVGKTTTRLLIYHILKNKYSVHTAKKNWNNHIGLPLTILETEWDDRLSILEAGMNHPGEIATLSCIVNPEIAVITNIGLSHIEYFEDKDQIAEAKIEIVEGMSSGSVLLINIHDPYKDLFVSRAKGAVKFFNIDDLFIINDLGVEGFIFGHSRYPGEEFFCPIPGKHLLLNLAIVFECVEIFQIPVSFVKKGLNDAAAAEMGDRMRVFSNKIEATVIADCYNASLESFNAAFDVLNLSEGRRIAVIGSILELGTQSYNIHRQLGEILQEKKCADLVLAVGEDMSAVCAELKTIPYCHFLDKEDVWEVLKNELKQGDTVLVKASNGMGLDVIVKALEAL